jgi:hypothetical protein
LLSMTSFLKSVSDPAPNAGVDGDRISRRGADTVAGFHGRVTSSSSQFSVRVGLGHGRSHSPRSDVIWLTLTLLQSGLAKTFSKSSQGVY